MPPHNGHRHLIQFAQSHIDHLTVIIFTKSQEPIPGHLRVQWMREIFPNIELIHVTDEHPVDFRDSTIWRRWIDSIRRVCPQTPDIVFSSEDYGDELAARLGARHILVDKARSSVPVSSSLIRNHPFDYWHFLPSCVRPYFLKRVCLLGAESTGKTTLAQALAKHFSTVWVPEYAREYLESKKGFCELMDIIPIAEGQVALEDSLAQHANRLLICDTNLIATMVWSEHYFSFCPAEILDMVNERKYDFYLVPDIDLPWIDDGLRDSPGHRDWFHNRFLSEVQHREVPYAILSGAFQKRLDTAIQTINAILKVNPQSSAMANAAEF